MMAMVVFGIGEIIGCFLIGYIVDKYGSRVASFMNTALILSAIVTTLFFLHNEEFGNLAYLMAFIWGVQDSGVNT